MGCYDIYGIIVFNDGHILHIWSVTVDIRRLMKMVFDYNDGQMVPEKKMWPKFPHICLRVEENPEKT